VILLKILYGGSFNPPTVAHYEIAKFIINKFPNSEFEFLPTNNFYKENNQKDFHYRCDMLDLVCSKLNGKATVNQFELNLDKYYGTAYTLKNFPGAFFLIGADNLKSIETWIDYPNVVINNNFIVMPRNDISIDEILLNNEILNKYKSHFLIIEDFSSVYVSSSLYRETLEERYLIKEVAKYIKDNNLYKE
jgi:nicotinate-nucleotide adenylyltransferase